jgi:hypothetical protein
MNISGNVGPAKSGDNTTPNVRQGRYGEIITSDGFGRYHEPTFRGQIYSASNQAGIASAAGLATASTVFTLYNPANSNTLISLVDISWAVTAAPAAATVIWLVGNLNPSQAAPATTTALTVINNNLALVSGVAKAYTTATLAAAPTVLRILGQIDAASNNTAGIFKDEIAGAIILSPGTYISVQALTATTIMASMTWQEIGTIV